MSECPYCKGTVHVPKASDDSVETLPEFKLTPKQKRIGMLLLASLAAIAGIAGLVNFITEYRLLNKSILEPLSESRIEQQTKKDADFAHFYAEASIIRDALKTTEDQEKYKDVTYKQLKEFLIYYGDKEYCDMVENEARKQHTAEIMSKVKPKIDDLKQKWETFIAEHNPAQYINIEVVEDGYGYSEMVFFGDYTKYPRFHFKSSEPKGAISDGKFTLECFNNEGANTSMISENIDYEFVKVHNSKEKYLQLAKYPQTDFWDIYNLRAIVHSVTLKDGTRISDDDIEQVPETVRNYLDRRDEDSEAQMIIDQIDKKFVSAKKYSFEALHKALMKHDPVCYELVERVNNISGQIQRGFSIY